MKKLLLLISLLLISCSSSNKVLNGKTFAFDCLWDINLYEGEQRNIDELISLINSISSSLDVNEEKANNGAYFLNEKRKISDPSIYLKECLEIGNNVRKQTPYFSLFCKDLKEKWTSSLKNNTVLDETIIKEELSKMNSSRVNIENNSISIIGDSNIDLGAIGKGYCLDKIKQYLDKNNIKSYCVNGGTSSILFGNTGKENKFKVSLRDYPSYSFFTSNSSLSTSSIFEQSYDIDGVKYSHIINPINGSSITNFSYCLLLDETIEDKEFPSSYLDAFSTSIMNMDKETALDFASSKGYKLCLGVDKEIIYSSNGLF